MQMIVRFLAAAAGNRILGCFQLHNHTGETLRKRVVNVSRHSISFFEYRSPPTLLGGLIEFKRKHDVMGQRPGYFYFLRPVGRTIDIANTYKATNLTPNQT